ncbi:undecaprenyl-diphosphate phosphatase [Candidatus Pacearchaeota archaeon]|nr:undecaprenyl-diphosphate phosphatase [Candidatus Pacearchaeota archaeon]
MEQFIASIILAIIQGISEWFPISSSGHLVLFSWLLGFKNSVAFDVTLHFGTLMAVFVYFGRDIVNIIEDILKGDWKSENSRLGFLLVIATIPAAVIGFIFKKIFEQSFESLWIVGIGFAITAIILLIASLDFKRNEKKMPNQKDAWLIGLAQAFAMFPGISRSGSTISTGLLRGLDAKNAMKFSFLMTIPAIFGASILELGTQKLPPSFIIPTIVSFAVGMLTIHLLLKIVSDSRKNLRWFALYEIIVAVLLHSYLIFK